MPETTRINRLKDRGVKGLVVPLWLPRKGKNRGELKTETVKYDGGMRSRKKRIPKRMKMTYFIFAFT